MKRLARLSLRLRLTLLFAVLTTAAWGMASVIAWQQTSKKLDKLFDTQQAAVRSPPERHAFR